MVTDPPLGLTYCAAGAYRRKTLFGTCVVKKRRTRSIVRCFSSSGSFHGNTVISAFGASEDPPYGKSWKTDLERLGGKKDIRDPRFVIEHGGKADYSLIT